MKSKGNQAISKATGDRQRPLTGQRVVVTRARAQAPSLSNALAGRGANVIEIPVIKILPPTDVKPLIESIAGIAEYEWLVFTSANGVTAFFDYFFKAFDDLRDIGAVRIAAVGPGTAAQLRQLHLLVDVMPEKHLGTAIVDALLHYQSIENVRILLLRVEVANPELPKRLEEKGAIVDDVACYRTVAETEDPEHAGTRLLVEGAEWLTFTSGSTVEHFHARFNLPDLLQRFPSLKTASIGPETSKVLAAHGLRRTVEANPHTTEGLVEAIERAVQAP